MDILHTFEVYQKQFDSLRKNNHFGQPQVLRQFRMQFKGFSNIEISTLISYLRDNHKKWFVAHLVDNLDVFPVDLLQPMLLAAVNEPDPSFNNDFIKPCRRVFDYVDIQQILLTFFRDGDTSKKIGVLKAFYWARPTVYISTILEENGIFQKQGYDTFFWDYELKKFNEDFKEDKDLYKLEHHKQEAAYIEQLKTILAEFDKTSDIGLKYQIALQLPQELKDYPKELQNQAKIYLQNKDKHGIPKNTSELDKVQELTVHCYGSYS